MPFEDQLSISSGKVVFSPEDITPLPWRPSKDLFKPDRTRKAEVISTPYKDKLVESIVKKTATAVRKELFTN